MHKFMNISNISINSKKKITLTAIYVLSVILVLCIVIVAVAGIYNALSGVGLSNGLAADKLTSYVATKDNSLYGSLILVNNSHEYTFPNDDHSPNANDHLVNIYSYGINNGGNYTFSGSDLWIHESAVSYTHNMLNKMADDMNATYMITSAYRTHADQEAMGSDVVAGYSDHHTGYCFSLRSETGSLSPTEYEWIHENAQNYGFIIRYPESKAPSTGVNGYPNCLRYVGTAHANLMKQNNLSLEEYIEYLKENAKNQPIGVKCETGEEYFIYYYAFEGKQINIQIPKDAEKNPFDISGTNDGGIVVTVKVK